MIFKLGRTYAFMVSGCKKLSDMIQRITNFMVCLLNLHCSWLDTISHANKHILFLSTFLLAKDEIYLSICNLGLTSF